PCLAEVDIGFNAPVAGSSLTTTTITLTPAVAGVTVTHPKTNQAAIVLPQPDKCGDPATPLLTPPTTYTATITTGVTDTYGVHFPAQATYTFKTGDIGGAM